jgi:hypothetical protein
MAEVGARVRAWYAAGAKTPLALRFVVGKTRPRRLSWLAHIGVETSVTVVAAPLPPRRTSRR